MEDLIVLSVMLGTFLPLVLLVAVFQRPARWRFVGWAVVFIILDFYLTSYGLDLQEACTKVLHWNWFGKLGSIGLGSTVLWRRPNLRREAGAVWKQHRGTLGFSLAATIALAGAAVWLTRDASRAPFRLETILFQALMPSLSEEIAFRGILLALLTRAFGDMGKIKGIPISWGVPLLVVFFGLGHAVYWTNGGLHLSGEALLYTGGVGAVIMAVRVASGSILIPIFMHSAFNLIVSVLPMIK